jgi:phosphoribosyl 1,2-cyclic phosphate phosphodiesterase
VRVTFLGTGTSHGVPSPACSCEVCCSPDPRDNRTRCSILVEWQGCSILVDTPPELRQQVIRSHVRRIDAILYTHSHADHIMGLDDVRRYNALQGGELPIYARPDVLDDIERAFRYIFVETQEGGGKPQVRLVPIEGEMIDLGTLRVEAIPLYHGELQISAFRFGSFAYATDASAIPAASIERLRGLDTLVLSALRDEPHPTHFSVGESLAMVGELRPRRAFFTHMAHNLQHQSTNRQLPDHVRLAYDGLILDIVEG